MLHLEPRELLTVVAIAPAGVLQFKEGADTTMNLGQFFSPNAPQGLQVSIDWGDGTNTNQILTSPKPDFQVTGSHAYSDETVAGKPNVVKVIVTDPNDGSSAGVQDTANVDEADQLSPLAFADFAANEGQIATATATFNNANLAGLAGDLTATIDWGDGTIDQSGRGTSGKAVAVTGGNGVFTVSGNHVYADGRTFAPVVTLSDDAPGTASASATATAKINEADQLSPATFADFVANEGQTATATATFNNSNFARLAGDLTATINWGDGKTDQGLAVTGSEGKFTVNGTHVYADEGTFTPIVTLSDDAPGVSSATATATAKIAEADQLSLASFADLAAIEGQTATATTTFNNANLAGLAGDLTATIDWGDGKTDQGLPVTGGAGSTSATLVFTVNGTHVYADEGTFAPIVTLSDDAPGIAIASATATAKIAEADQFTVAAFANFAAIEGQTATATATFKNANLAGSAGGFTAAIDWGDGKTDQSVAVIGGAELLTASGKHVYADEGAFAPIVTISDNAPGIAIASATATAKISEGDVLLATPTPVSDTENIPLSNVQVASFTGNDADAVASDFTATINWGDAVASSGTVAPGAAGVFLITGAHTYLDEGPYTITAVVRDTDSSSAPTTINVTATVAKGLTGGIHGTSAQDFVGHTYRDILLRPADQSSFKSLSQILVQGTPFATVAAFLDHSGEYFGLVVDRAYESYLGRGPDPDGRNYWVNAFEHGLTDEDMTSRLVASDEYFHNAGGTNQTWIDATYLSLFQRAADLGGESFWLAALAHGESRFQVASSIAGSPEHERFVVQADYAHFLVRTGGDAEISYWVRQMNQGLSDEDLITLLVTSDEYLRRIGG